MIGQNSQFENQVESGLFSPTSEKTSVDKLLGRGDVERAREIIKKPRLKREDLMELLNLLSSNEVKLLNYSDWDRYIMAKYFVWIREFVSLAESLHDYKEDMSKKYKGHITERSRKIFDNNMRLMEHNIKFLVDLYFNLARTTLSLGMSGFNELLKNKFEMIYPAGVPNSMPVQPAQPEQKKLQFRWSR